MKGLGSFHIKHYDFKVVFPTIAHSWNWKCLESGFIEITRTTRYGQRCFAVSGPTLWNSLPLSVRDPSLTLTQFCARLKTVLFCRAYETLA